MVEAKVIVPADHPDGNRDSFRTPGTLLRAVHVQRPASSPAPASRRPELHTPTLCGLGRESFQAHSWGVLWRLRILFPWVPTACRRNGRCTTPWHGYRRCSGSQARCPPVGASAVRASCSTFSATGRRRTTCDTTRSTLTSACCHLLASRCMTKRQRGPKPPVAPARLSLPSAVCAAAPAHSAGHHPQASQQHRKGCWLRNGRDCIRIEHVRAPRQRLLGAGIHRQ
jgi:hypothetical protein